MSGDFVSLGAVLEIVMQYCPDDDGSCTKAGVDLREMLDEIENLPDVDAEPVRHGRWIITFCGGADYTRTSPFRYRCSECGLYSDNKYPYCHCGAKLDLEETE